MKRFLLFMVLGVIAPTLFSSDSWAQGESKANSQTSQTRAVEGEEVWVVVNTVKADKREQFEKLHYDILWPGAKKLSESDQRVLNSTRLLLPSKANEDGTYTYLWIMDPVIRGGNYQLHELLKSMYGEEKGIEYTKMLSETFAKPPVVYSQAQSRAH